MADQYKAYLNQLHQSPVPQSIFTAKQLFYIKTCSLLSCAYFFTKPEDSPYTPEELIHHFGPDYLQIILLHTYTIESWSAQLLTCITHSMALFTSCFWWVGEKGSQAKIVFRTELAACEYIDALIHIIDYKPIFQSITIHRSNDPTILLDMTLFSIMNIAQNGDFLWFLRSKSSLPDTLLTILKISVCNKVRLCIYGILSEILCDKSLKELKISDSAISFFFDLLEEAWQHPSKKVKQIPIFFLLKCLVNFSKIDAVQQKIADTNKVLLLIEMCDQYPIIYDILWALSFNHDIQEQLRSNTSFITKLAQLPKQCDNQQIRKITYGLLWNLEINHEDRTTSASSDKKKFELMISYSHKDKIFCKQLYDELINAGYRVWIDFDQVHGNVMDAMAQAIEQSSAVQICMSEKYRKSNYCRAEANYAFQRRIRIVPVLAQKHYKPDGWLLFLVGQLIYVDFTKYEFSKAMEMLIKELKAPIISEICLVNVDPKEEVDATIPITSISSEPSSMLILPENILNWNETHVQDWLISHGLLQMSRLFTNLNGRSLMYMSEMIENVELQRVVSLLQDDSLRRTSQSLSLVEFTHFRSLLDQQKQSLKSTIVTEPTKVETDDLKRKSFFYCQII